MEEDIKQCEDLIRILDKTSETGKSKHTDCIRNLIARNKELEQNYINPSKARFTYFDNGKGTKVVIEGFISKSKVREKLLKPIQEEGEKAYKSFMSKKNEENFEIDGALLQELGHIESMIIELLED